MALQLLQCPASSFCTKLGFVLAAPKIGTKQGRRGTPWGQRAQPGIEEGELHFGRGSAHRKNACSLGDPTSAPRTRPERCPWLVLPSPSTVLGHIQCPQQLPWARAGGIEGWRLT